MQTGRICGFEERITLRVRYIPNIKPFGECFDPSCVTVQRVHRLFHGCHNETFELHRKNITSNLAVLVPCSI